MKRVAVHASASSHAAKPSSKQHAVTRQPFRRRASCHAEPIAVLVTERKESPDGSDSDQGASRRLTTSRNVFEHVGCDAILRKHKAEANPFPTNELRPLICVVGDHDRVTETVAGNSTRADADLGSYGLVNSSRTGHVSHRYSGRFSA